MNRNPMFEQLRGYIEQLEKMSSITPDQMPKYLQQQLNPTPEPSATDKLMEEYSGVLEQEFVRDKRGQEFARKQFEEAQKYLITMYMDTPEGKKLSEERAKAFKEFGDSKLKDFLESKKNPPAESQPALTQTTENQPASS